LDTVLAIGESGWHTTDPLLKLRSELDGELREKATANLPDELKNITYETLVAQRQAETMKHFEADPESKKRFDEHMEAAREYYQAQQALDPVPVIAEPENPVTELLENLSQARHKKRESVFWSCVAISKLVEEKALSPSIIPAITDDIIDIHKNWHWPQ
jgi:hypothetical protein